MTGYDEPPYDPDYDRPTEPTRLPTADRAAEQAVLATLIYTPNGHTHLDPELDTTDFYWPTHANLWDTWHHLHRTNGTPPDPVTLNATLIAQRDTNTAHLLASLAANPANPLLSHQHAKIVRDAARLRTVDDLATGLRQLVTTARADQIDTYLGEALQRLDDTVMRFGPRTTPTNTGLHDLTWITNGTPPHIPPPTHCRRTDGTALFYPAKVNGIFGDPEAGKTWIAQAAGIEALNDGGTFAMVDIDHNGPNHTTARLLLLGAHPHHLADPNRFRYYEPDDPDQLRNAITDITTWAPTITLIDSIGELLPLLGTNTNDGDEVTNALRTTCLPPAQAGSCVITIDHLPKSTEARSTGYAIGSIAKKRMMRGAYLRAETLTQPTPGGIGRVALRIEKDTTGELRRSSQGGYAGTFTLDSTHDHITTWSIARETTPRNDDGTFRPTNYMEKVATYVANNPECSGRDIETAIHGTAKHIRTALNILIAEGHITRQRGPNRAWHHTLTIPYREAEDDHAQATL